jgi:hypothetical protein
MPSAAPLRPGLVKTLTDVAKAFDLDYRSVKLWPKRDGWPGKIGGAFDLVAIAVWRERTFDRRGGRQERNDGDDETGGIGAAQTRKEWAAAKLKELELERETGKVIEVDAVTRLLARSIATHNAQANQLKDRVLQLLPAKFPAKDRKRIVAGVTKAVDDLRRQMAEAAEEFGREFDPQDGGNARD